MYDGVIVMRLLRAARGVGLSVSVATLLAATPGRGWGDDAERLALGRIRLTTDPGLAAGCARLGTARDDSVKDLRRKIVRAGGDTAVLSFGLEDIHAEVFRCAGARPAPAPGPPGGIPPPPPGPPPPPPPDSWR